MLYRNFCRRDFSPFDPGYVILRSSATKNLSEMRRLAMNRIRRKGRDPSPSAQDDRKVQAYETQGGGAKERN
jgi:hypothetical protein